MGSVSAVRIAMWSGPRNISWPVRLRTAVALLLVGLSAQTAHSDFYDGLAAYRRGDYEEALRQLEPVAARGEIEAQYLVGSIHADPAIGLVDETTAFQWFRRAAEQGHARAQQRLGDSYEHGRGVGPDDASAVRWYRQAALQGLAVAQADLAAMFDQGRGVPQNSSKAANWFRDAAEQGHSRAQFNLATMFQIGRGVGESQEKAAKWYRRAAKQGHPQAQNALGLMLDAGRGVERNTTRAANWYRRAAEQGLPAARRNLGSMYAQGEGVPLDPDEARRWLDLAAGSESVDPELLRDEIAVTLVFETPPGFDDVEEEPNAGLAAVSSAISPAPPGSDVEPTEAEALYRRGRAHSSGTGVEQDYARAEQWYLQAARLGHEMAWYRLGFAHMRGQNADGRKDPIRAYAWFSLAAERDFGDAVHWRDRVGKKLKPAQLSEALALVESWRREQVAD